MQRTQFAGTHESKRARTFLLVDASASMGYHRQQVSKLSYSSYLAAALAYLLARQGDPAGLLVFDERTRQLLPPRTRGGHIRDLLVALEALYPAGRTEPGRALAQVGEMTDRRSLVVLFTDLLDAPADLSDRLRQVRSRGNDVVLFHLLDPQEIKPKFKDTVLLVDMENNTEALEVSPEYARNEYRRRIDSHIELLSSKARGAGLDYFLMDTARPLDEGLREYLAVRRGKL